MKKVYNYPQKIFKYFGALALIFGVVSCSTSQSTASAGGETDGIYYSPSKDGRVGQAANVQSGNDYDIKMGGAYFDADGNGAEDFYYDVGETAAQTETANNGNNQTVNIYTGGSNVTMNTGATTDWGRYDGMDITVNNYYGGWGYSWPYYGWGYPRWRTSLYFGWGWGGYYGWPYYGWGGYHGWGGYYGWSGYYGWGSPYYGWGGYYGPYYGYGYGNGYYGYYNRGTAVAPGTRPGSGLSSGTPNRVTRPLAGAEFGRGGLRTDYVSSGNVRPGLTNTGVTENPGVRPSVTGNVNANTRPTTNGNVQQNSGVRPNVSGNVRPTTPDRANVNGNVQNSGVRPTESGNVRPTAPARPNVGGNVNQNTNVRPNQGATTQPQRPVRQSPPVNVRPNTPTQSPNIRQNTPNRQPANIRGNSAPSRNDSNMRSNTPSRSSGNMNRSSGSMNRSSGSINRGSSTMGSGSRSGGAVRSGGGVRR